MNRTTLSSDFSPALEAVWPEAVHLSPEEEADERAYEPDELVYVGSYEPAGDGGKAPPFSWRKLLAFTGPGFLMSIAYIDPGNIESDLQAGARTGYYLLWILLWATAMGLLLQLLAARLGVATGLHLAELCRAEYPRPVSHTLWILAEIAIVGSDIQEVIGSAIAIRLLSFGAIPLWGGVCITAFDGFIFLFLESFGVRKLEAFFGALITIMAVTFAWMFFQAQPNLTGIAKGLIVPYVPHGAASMAVSIVGAVIMPHNIFLHSALVQSRQINRSHQGEVREALRYYTIESSVALAVSFFVNLFVVAVFAKLFYGLPAASSIGLATAGMHLQEAFGSSGFPVVLIWSAGLLAAGQSSTMTGTYAGQFVMSGFLDLRVKKWLRVLITRSVAIVPTIAVALAFDSSENKLDVLNEWLNVLQSVQLPFAILPLLALVSSPRVMGAFVVNRLTKVAAWAVAVLVIVINCYIMIDFVNKSLPHTVVIIASLAIFGTIYLAFVIYLILGPALVRNEIHAGWQVVSKARNEQAEPLITGTSTTNGGSRPLQ